MIKILENVYNRIVEDTPLVPPESGGILGINRNGIITEFYQDLGNSNYKGYSYIPNISSLNNIINQWHNKDIQLIGIYHSHCYYDTYLSSGDLKYIKDILQSLDNITDNLYFPLVFPKEKMVFFKAMLCNSKVKIFYEDISILT